MVARAERLLARRAGVNLVVSALDRARLQAVAGDIAVSVVPNGVDVEFFQPVLGVRAQDSHLVFAGGMDWFPNREAMTYLARELWPALKSDLPERRMTVVGRNPPPELLQAAGGDSSLRVTGFVDDVRPYISSASIYICPITVGGGTRLKILDALAMSRPLISTDLGVEGLDLEEGVHYLRANTTAEFVSQVRRLERDTELGARLAGAGRAFVQQRYAWPVIARALDEAWRGAVAG
jgi:glycosyltransferase involved in cell wall biosynthesis